MRFSPRSRWVKAGSLRRISCTHNTLFVMRNTDVGVETLSMHYSNHDNYHRGHNHICDLSARCLTHKLSKHTLVPFSILQKSTVNKINMIRGWIQKVHMFWDGAWWMNKLKIWKCVFSFSTILIRFPRKSSSHSSRQNSQPSSSI